MNTTYHQHLNKRLIMLRICNTNMSHVVSRLAIETSTRLFLNATSQDLSLLRVHPLLGDNDDWLMNNCQSELVIRARVFVHKSRWSRCICRGQYMLTFALVIYSWVESRGQSSSFCNTLCDFLVNGHSCTVRRKKNPPR